jgi:hypothetical protein
MRSEIEVDEAGGTVTWIPSNLPDGRWWYWRVRASQDVDVDDADQRTYGPWSRVGFFYTNFEDAHPPPDPPMPLDRYQPDPDAARNAGSLTPPVIRGPAEGQRVDTPNPRLVIETGFVRGERLLYQFEVDQVPSFDGSFLQSSDDRPILFEALKPNVIVLGFAIGVVSFFVLSVFGLPILLIFGYVQSMTVIPHLVITQIIGALLARYYFWKRFGKQQWRLYAAVLMVGFTVGMSLVGMASVAIAMIQKSVSVLLF